jgi:hypothetical protein
MAREATVLILPTAAAISSLSNTLSTSEKASQTTMAAV